jgi:methylmalonyl-CoA/ethylmalonyl-CoA epimerase
MKPYWVALSVPSVEAATAWYREQLGFALLERKDFPSYEVKIAILELNGFRLELIEHRRALSPAEVQRRIPEIQDWSHVHGFVKLAFLVEKVAPVAERLRRQGVKFQTQVMPADGLWGDSFIVRDLNGNWIQFAEPPRQTSDAGPAQADGGSTTPARPSE